jgi:sugar phosphate isomerase/epimerase
MRFGICASVESLGLAAEAGCDYIEPAIAALAPGKADSDFAPVRRQFETFAIKPEAFNCFIPGNLKITGPSIDSSALSAHVQVACQRAAQVGGRVIVFGSGGARGVPEGFPRDRALDQIVAFLRMAGDHAADSGIVIAIEPLRAAECNIIHFVSEAVDIARRVDHPAVQVLADGYHVWQGSEPLGNIAAAGPLLAHTHIAEAVGRRAPQRGDGTDYQAFFAAIKQAGFDGRCSIECRWDDCPSQAPAGIRLLREAWQNA